MMFASDRSVEIVEVSPRDGLQDEPEIVTAADKIAPIGGAGRFASVIGRSFPGMAYKTGGFPPSRIDEMEPA